MKKIIAIALLISTFSACVRKTDEDPLLSFRSRKDRVIGSWHAKSGTILIESPTWSETYTINGSTFIYANPSGSVSGTGVTTFVFERKGNCSITINFGGYINNITGTWNLTGGIGEHKNKSEIAVHAVTITDGSGTSTFEGNDYSVTYEILELKHKEMKLKLTYKRTDSSTQYIKYIENWTLVQ